MSFIAWARLLRTGKTVVMQFFLFLIPWDISWTRQKLLQSLKCWGHSLTSSFLEMNLSLSLLQSLKKLDWVALVQDVSPKIHGPLVIKGFPVLRLSWQDTWTQKWFFTKKDHWKEKITGEDPVIFVNFKESPKEIWCLRTTFILEQVKQLFNFMILLFFSAFISEIMLSTYVSLPPDP